MIYLNSINPLNIISDNGFNQYVQEYFPLSKTYLSNDEFIQEKYEWFFITDDMFSREEEREAWLGMICVTEDKFIKKDNLHLSVLEVANPIRGLNIGTRIVSSLIDIARKNGYTTLSLQIQNPELLKFYIRFGFAYENVGGHDVYVLYL